MRYVVSKHNRRRAKKAASALKAYSKRVGAGAEGYEVWMIDLITDLLHLAAQHKIDFNKTVDFANTHFEAEAGGQE